MMTDRGHAAQQVLDPAPKKTERLGHLQMLSNGIAVRARKYPRAHALRIGVGSATEARIQIELQVIVSIDQAGQSDVAARIDPP